MDNIKNIRLSSIIFEDGIIKSLIGFHPFTPSNYVSSFYRTENASCFKILQASSKFQSKFATLKMTVIYDDLLLPQYAKKDMNEVRFVKDPTKYQHENKIIRI